MRQSLAGRAVLVTGGSGGIGRAIALAYAARGARIAFTYATNEQAAQDVAAEIRAAGGEGHPVQMDLADRASVAIAVDTAIDQLGGLDVAVANARWRDGEQEGRFADIDFDEWCSAVRTSIEGTALTIKSALPALETSDAGRVVMISSGVSRDGIVGRTAYSTGKAALNGLMASLRWEIGPQGVLVNIVEAGFTLTEENEQRMPEAGKEALLRRTPSGHLSRPDDIAAAVVFLGSPDNTNVNGLSVPVAG